jgi:hypothetical protein
MPNQSDRAHRSPRTKNIMLSGSARHSLLLLCSLHVLHRTLALSIEFSREEWISNDFKRIRCLWRSVIRAWLRISRYRSNFSSRRRYSFAKNINHVAIMDSAIAVMHRMQSMCIHWWELVLHALLFVLRLFIYLETFTSITEPGRIAWLTGGRSQQRVDERDGFLYSCLTYIRGVNAKWDETQIEARNANR